MQTKVIFHWSKANGPTFDSKAKSTQAASRACGAVDCSTLWQAVCSNKLRISANVD